MPKAYILLSANFRICYKKYTLHIWQRRFLQIWETTIAFDLFSSGRDCVQIEEDCTEKHTLYKEMSICKYKNKKSRYGAILVVNNSTF